MFIPKEWACLDSNQEPDRYERPRSQVENPLLGTTQRTIWSPS
jgi:hypothetical protein